VRAPFKRLLISRPAAYLLHGIIRCYTWTLRVEITNEREWMEHLEAGGRVLLCSWHQQFFSIIRHFRVYREFRPAIMISQSVDGDLIAGVARRVGWVPIRGSSSRGSKGALAGMIKHLRASRLAAHIVDGPRGPAGRVKAGAIRLAHAADASIVPFYVTAERAWYSNSWDRFFIPKPFSRVVVRFGSRIVVEPTDDRDTFEAQRLRVENIMRAEGGM